MNWQLELEIAGDTFWFGFMKKAMPFEFLKWYINNICDTLEIWIRSTWILIALTWIASRQFEVLTLKEVIFMIIWLKVHTQTGGNTIWYTPSTSIHLVSTLDLMYSKEPKNYTETELLFLKRHTTDTHTHARTQTLHNLLIFCDRGWG